eukprot:TRINITY_DN56907_c0_g1_i2.p1 TRINITY_DN56907_c0_g1~~TRINITY_DN56907_c0_g1_i2.p1  ORF type:complete len:167 (+),score=46.18 TRINITY_DN56907_c0_g1_i2:132-632(+)
MIRRPPRSTLSSSSAASDVYKRQEWKDTRSAVYVTLVKENQHFWDQLLDRSSGPGIKFDLGRWVDIPSSDEHRDLGDGMAISVQQLTASGALEAAVNTHSLLVVLLHFPWCTKWTRRPNEVDVLAEFNRATVVHSLGDYGEVAWGWVDLRENKRCLLYTSPSPRDS